MTAERLRHLAELTEEAAQFTTNTSSAGTHDHPAGIARLQAASLARQQAQAGLCNRLSDIRAQPTES